MDGCQYSAADPTGYRRIQYPPPEQKEVPSPPDTVQKPNGKVRKFLLKAREVSLSIHFIVALCSLKEQQAITAMK